jgi:flavin-dependent dehydrogenase
MTDALSSNEARAVIEACPEGWWYSSGLPGNVLILAFMTDADLIPSAQEKALEYFYERLQESELTRSRLGQLIAPNVFRRFAADSCLRVAVSKNWLATGDAAMTFDPLSSQGVLKALVSGQSAAKAVLAAQSGSQTALQEYADTLTRGFQSYMDTRLQYYSAEQRWPTSPFWRRRHHAQFSGRGKQL